jgi:hypothetical protein
MPLRTNLSSPRHLAPSASATFLVLLTDLDTARIVVDPKIVQHDLDTSSDGREVMLTAPRRAATAANGRSCSGRSTAASGG